MVVRPNRIIGNEAAKTPPTRLAVTDHGLPPLLPARTFPAKGYCPFPTGDTKRGEWFMCGRKSKEPKVWCEGHMAIVFRPENESHAAMRALLKIKTKGL